MPADHDDRLHDELLQRAVAELRRPVRLDPAVDQRALEEIRAESSGWPASANGHRWGVWIAGAAIAAGLLVAVVLPGRPAIQPRSTGRRRGPGRSTVAPGRSHLRLDAPASSAVAVVGDFNDWDPAATPLRPTGDGRRLDRRAAAQAGPLSLHLPHRRPPLGAGPQRAPGTGQRFRRSGLRAHGELIHVHRPRHLLVSLLLILPSVAAAQDARLAERLDAATAASVQQMVDSARTGGLPTEPLVQKALEGGTLGASGERDRGRGVGAARTARPGARARWAGARAKRADRGGGRAPGGAAAVGAEPAPVPPVGTAAGRARSPCSPISSPRAFPRSRRPDRCSTSRATAGPTTSSSRCAGRSRSSARAAPRIR